MKAFSSFALGGFLAVALLFICAPFAGAVIPSETTLRKPAKIQFTTGSSTGTMNLPAGLKVNVSQMAGDQVLIEVGAAKAWIPIAATDFAERLAAQDAAAQNVQIWSQNARPVQMQGPLQEASSLFGNRLEGYVSPLERGPYGQAYPVIPATPAVSGSSVQGGDSSGTSGTGSPLDRGPYNRTRSVVDHYDIYGNRYNIGVFGQRIYN